MSHTSKIGSPFSAIPVFIVESPSVSRDAKFLYSVLWRYSNNVTREATVARSTLAVACNVKSLRTIDRWIGELVALGAVEKMAGGGRDSSHYKLHTAPVQEIATRAASCSAPVQPVAPHPCNEMHGTSAASCSAPVQPVAPVLERSKKETEEAKRETKAARETEPKNEPEQNTFGDAFDTPTPIVQNENPKVKSLTDYVFALFLTRGSAKNNRIATLKAKNPPQHERDKVFSALAQDPDITRDEIKELFEFASTHDRFWRQAANTPVKFANHIAKIATDFAADKPSRLQ